VIGSTRQVVVYAYRAPVDLRKGFDGLSAVVVNDLGRDLSLAKISSDSLRSTEIRQSVHRPKTRA